MSRRKTPKRAAPGRPHTEGSSARAHRNVSNPANLLEQLQRHNQLILQAAGEGIYGLDAEGKTTFVNPAAARMLGWDAQALIGQPMHALLHHSRPDGSHYPREECPIYAAFTDGKVHRVEDEVFWRKDGSSFPVEYTSTPIREDGELVGAVVVFWDVSERNAAAQALRDSEERFRKLFDSANDGIFVVDPSTHRILNANRRICEMLGYSRDELLAMRITDVHAHEVEKLMAFAQAVVSRGHGQTDELACLAKRGGRVPAEISAASFVDSDDGQPLVLASVRDITERKQAEAALRAAHAEVQALKERLQAENTYLQEEIKSEHNFEEIIGESAPLSELLEKVRQVAPTDATVLIHGETGTGKELIARAIHNLSPRADRPLVKVNCGAISAGLVESELFGHEKGAFTGALQKRTGRFELANGGTIFLDEVGELPQDTQVKLLRVLQEREFERVGSSQSIEVDVRIIAATNRDLAERVKADEFRMDLFYRLNVFPLTMPPLRERRDDIPLLTAHLLEKLSTQLGKTLHAVSDQALDCLMRYAWPGNVRELENVLERAAIVARGPVIEVDGGLVPETGDSAVTVDGRTLEDVERAHILAVLQSTNWAVSGKQGAASVLGLNASTLRSRMQKLGIRKPKIGD